MKTNPLIFKLMLAVMFLLLLSAPLMAQTISGVDAIPPGAGNPQWVIEISFVPAPKGIIKNIFLVNVDDAEIITLAPLTSMGSGLFTTTPSKALERAADNKSFAKHYELRAAVESNKNRKLLSLGAEVELLDDTAIGNQVEKVGAKSAEDADIYISGEINGARKRRASFTTEIKLQKYYPITPSWRHTPFFKLNASTDPDADPDKLEAGWNFRYIIGSAAYFDQAVKLESERDFDNTNLLYNPRLTFLPPAGPKKSKTFKTFFNPYIGGEFGKNLRSPLAAAEHDGIARLLAGADLRLVFFLKNGKEPDINWTTSYTRRWLLTDELSFKADDNGDLQLRSFGRSPRDYVLSKVSYKVTKFLDAFVAYEWGQVPPSYKLVDSRYRLGFAYKYKFGVK